MANAFWAIAALLVVVWALGLSTSYTMGGLIHVLLILAIVAVVANLFMGRRASA